MICKIIVDEQEGRKWEIYKKAENEYSYKYYEFFKQTGWRLTGTEDCLSKESIEYDFDMEVA